MMKVIKLLTLLILASHLPFFSLAYSQNDANILLRDKAIFRIENKVYFFSDVQEFLRAFQYYQCLKPENKISSLFFKGQKNILTDFGPLPRDKFDAQQLQVIESIIDLLKLEIYSWRQTRAVLTFKKSDTRCPIKNVKPEFLQSFAGIDEYLNKKYTKKKVTKIDLKNLTILLHRKIKHHAFY